MEESLRYIVPEASHDLPVEGRRVYFVEGEEDRYSIDDGHKVLACGMSRASALNWLFNDIQDRTLESMPEWSWIHAGCGDLRGRRFLVLGEKYAGKSTLMSKLLLAGIEARGDESVLMRGDVVVPVPRKFYVREGSLPLLPELARIAARLPFVTDFSQGRVLAFDPRDAGLDWRISISSVDAIFALVRNHSGATRLEGCPKYRMAEYVMRQSYPSVRRGRSWVRDVCAMVDRADTYQLHIGDLEQALDAITAVLVA
jgi:hypothetical protein